MTHNVIPIFWQNCTSRAVTRVETYRGLNSARSIWGLSRTLCSFCYRAKLSSDSIRARVRRYSTRLLLGTDLLVTRTKQLILWAGLGPKIQRWEGYPLKDIWAEFGMDLDWVGQSSILGKYGYPRVSVILLLSSQFGFCFFCLRYHATVYYSLINLLTPN